MLSITESISKRVTEHAYAVHGAQFRSLCIDSPDKFQAHIAQVLEGEETRCFTKLAGTRRQADYYWDPATNTGVIVPADTQYEPTAYRPKEGWFQKQLNEAQYDAQDLGLDVIEPKQGGIYALKNIPRQQEQRDQTPPEVEGRDVSGGEAQTADAEVSPIAAARPEPQFLSREVLDSINEFQAETHGGEHEVRDETAVDGLLEKAQKAHYENPGADLYDVAGVYVAGLASQQPYADMNEHTAAQAGIVFLEANGVDTSRLPEKTVYEAIESAANREASAQDVAEEFRAAIPERAVQPPSWEAASMTQEQSIPSSSRHPTVQEYEQSIQQGDNSPDGQQQIGEQEL